MANLRKTLKRAAYNFADWYRIIYRKKDWRAFATKHTHSKLLTAEQIEEARNFFKPYTEIEPIFFEFYREKHGKFDVRFIPDDIYYCYVDPHFNDWHLAKRLDNKCFYRNMFPAVQQPELVLRRMNSIWFDGKDEILSEKDVLNLLQEESNLFVKIATESDGGQGVRHFADAADVDQFWKFVQSTASDIVVQRGVIQHPDLCKLNSSSVNTIRILSLLGNDGVKLYSAVLRMGVNGSKVDNEASGGRTCGILPDGTLKAVAHNKYGDCCTEHPNSHISFDGYVVPGFDKVCQVVPSLHKQVPHFRLISWDFAVDLHGEPVLIEANFRYGGVTIHQLNNGPIFGDDTEKILQEVFSK